MNLLGYDRTAQLEATFTVDLPPDRVYQLLRGEAGTNEGVTDVIDESPPDAPGTVWRLRVQIGGSARWIRSRVVVDEPPVRLDVTCASTRPLLKRFETVCSYVLRPGTAGDTLVAMTVLTPAGAGNRLLRPRNESQLRERLEIGARQWAARVSGDASAPVAERTVRVYGRAVPLTLFGVVTLTFFVATSTRSYLVLPLGAVLGWFALGFAMRRSASITTRPVATPHAVRVRTIRQVRIRRNIMVAIASGCGLAAALGTHHWSFGLIPFGLAMAVQWLGLRALTAIRR
jgi:hypothetical protein